ncbi:hypothetical protein SAMN04488580_103429 [Mycobacterium sp. 283mftsu]|nr:hypothetical protein SAMN04488580_103429 [Mycobacterium sp. 283mftsu]
MVRYMPHRKPTRTMAATAAAALAMIGSSMAPAHAADEYLDGTYRIDFHGAAQAYTTAPAPTVATSATYRFTTNCSDGQCVATGMQLSSTDHGIFDRPTVTLYWAGLAWRLSESMETPCPGGAGTRSQEMTWSLTPQRGSDVLPGARSLMPSTTCVGDATGYIVEPMLATPII